jgi:hypothetical protein
MVKVPRPKRKYLGVPKLVRKYYDALLIICESIDFLRIIIKESICNTTFCTLQIL